MDLCKGILACTLTLAIVAGCAQHEDTHDPVDRSALWTPSEEKYQGLLERYARRDQAPGTIVLKLVEGPRVALRDGRLATDDLAFEDELHAIARFLRQAGITAIRSAMAPGTPDAIDDMREELVEQYMVDVGDLNSFFVLEVPAGTDRVEIARALGEFEGVELAYAGLQVQLASPDCAGCDPLACAAGSLVNPDLGAGRLACLAGGRGENVTLIHLEAGWNLNHRELSPAQVSYRGDFPAVQRHTGEQAGEQTRAAVHHGTAMASLLVARQDGSGTTGLLPAARLRAVDLNALRTDGQRGMCLPLALGRVWAEASAGDVVLAGFAIANPDDPGADCVPVEIDPLVRRVVRGLTARGVHVVEAAGNCARNLDDPGLLQLFDRTVFDSGAILVAASRDREPAADTNHGRRVDLHAPGTGLVTAGYGDLLQHEGTPLPPARQPRYVSNEDYTTQFGGTSAASATVAAVVGGLESVAEATGATLDPCCLRGALAVTARPQQHHTRDRWIGGEPVAGTALLELNAMQTSVEEMTCLEELDVTWECSTGRDCSSGRCVLAPAGSFCARTCTSDDDCSDGRECVGAGNRRTGESARVCTGRLSPDQVGCICRTSNGMACPYTAGEVAGLGSGAGSDRADGAGEAESESDPSILVVDAQDSELSQCQAEQGSNSLLSLHTAGFDDDEQMAGPGLGCVHTMLGTEAPDAPSREGCGTGEILLDARCAPLALLMGSGGWSLPATECPAGYQAAGYWHTGPGWADGAIEGTDHEGGTIDHGWMWLCSADPGRVSVVALVDDLGGTDLSSCSGQVRGRWHVGSGFADPHGLAHGVDVSGRSIQSGWLGLCVTGNAGVKVEGLHGDCGSAVPGCGDDANLGSWHTNPANWCDPYITGQGDGGSTILTGWMALCIEVGDGSGPGEDDPGDGPGPSDAYLESLFRDACYCVNCGKNDPYGDGRNETEEAIALGCRYIRWGVYPWGEAGDSHDSGFDRLASMSRIDPEVVIEFGIPEMVADLHLGDNARLDRPGFENYPALLDRALDAYLGSSRRIDTPAPFGRADVCYDGAHGGTAPDLARDMGWAWHLYMAMRAIDSGAGSINFPQLNLRVGWHGDLWRFFALIDAIQEYALDVRGGEVIIGTETVHGYPYDAGFREKVDFMKMVMDSDVASRDAGGFYARDRNGGRVDCLGSQSLLAHQADTIAAAIGGGAGFHPDMPIGPMCMLARNRVYNQEGHAHPEDPFDNPQGIRHVFWELDGCHHISWKWEQEGFASFEDFRDAHGLTPYASANQGNAVWFKRHGDDSVTSGYGNVRNGLTTTIQFLSQPQAVRQAFIRTMYELVLAKSRGSDVRYYFPQPFKLDQNHYWQVDSGSNAYQQSLVRQCPADDGTFDRTMHTAGAMYWSDACGDSEVIRELLLREEPAGDYVALFDPGGLLLGTNEFIEGDASALIQQDDGNLVLYRRDAWGAWQEPMWAAGTAGCQAAGGCGASMITVFQEDGNLVTYTVKAGQWIALWAAASNGAAAVGQHVDGHFDVLDGQGGTVWSTRGP